MKLKIEFNYKLESDISKKEWELLEALLENGVYESRLNNEINKLYLIKDGRKEYGGISDFNCEVEE